MMKFDFRLRVMRDVEKEFLPGYYGMRLSLLKSTSGWERVTDFTDFLALEVRDQVMWAVQRT